MSLSMGFTPHCSFDIKVQGNIMICKMDGVWNMEGLSVYFNELKEKALPLSSDKWVRIADITTFEGGPMELMEQLIAIQNWSVQNNCMQLYLVNPKPLNRAVLEQNKGKYSGVTFCDSMDKALNLAQEQLC